MKLYPPPVVNEQVTADMLRWVMLQPNTIAMNTVTNKFTVTPAKGAQDFPIDDRTKEFMLFELQKILEFNGFVSELSEGQLRVYKGLWCMEVPGILAQMPFPDYLPRQINNAYENWEYEQDNLDRAMSYELSKPQYNLYTDPYPSREHLEEVRRIVEDSINDTNKD